MPIGRVDNTAAGMVATLCGWKGVEATPSWGSGVLSQPAHQSVLLFSDEKVPGIIFSDPIWEKPKQSNMKSYNDSDSCETSLHSWKPVVQQLETGCLHESKFRLVRRLVRSEGGKGGHWRLQRRYWRPLIVSISPSSSCSATGMEVREEQPDSSHCGHSILP